MASERLTGTLAVILHADVVGSTALVQQDEQNAHQRIQDSFQRFGKLISDYHGRVCELRGDALLAEFERASDAVSAALAFQLEQDEFNRHLPDDIRPLLRIGIALGEVVIADPAWCWHSVWSSCQTQADYVSRRPFGKRCRNVCRLR